MLIEAIITKHIQRIYREEHNNPHSKNLFRDFSQGLSYSLGDRTQHESFISVEPSNSQLLQLLEMKYHFDIGYNIKELIETIIYSLMSYGTAYLYIDLAYEDGLNEDGEITKSIKLLGLGEVRGKIGKRHGENIDFYALSYSGEIVKRNIKADNLLIFKLKDLGFSKKHFKKIACQLDKLDVTSNALDLIKAEGYDFAEHARRNLIKELILTKDIGWTSLSADLSSSQILYRHIKLNKLRILMLNYIVEKMNSFFSDIFPNDKGRIIINYRISNYDDLWEKYCQGKIFVSELSRLVI